MARNVLLLRFGVKYPHPNKMRHRAFTSLTAHIRDIASGAGVPLRAPRMAQDGRGRRSWAIVRGWAGPAHLVAAAPDQAARRAKKAPGRIRERVSFEAACGVEQDRYWEQQQNEQRHVITSNAIVPYPGGAVKRWRVICCGMRNAGSRCRAHGASQRRAFWWL